LLIQRSLAPQTPQSPNVESSNAVQGWTLIVPKGWGMPFLLAFSQAGIRIGGLRDRSQQATESGSADFPRDYPATTSCKELVEAEAEEDRQTWERKPPAKRSSWDKLGTRSPWKPDWEVVLGLRLMMSEDLMACDREDNQGMESDNSIWHFQGSKSNMALENMISSTTPDIVLLEWVNNLRVQGGLERLTLDPKTLLNSALITVQIAVTSRGAPERHAHIYYLPDDEAKEWARLHSQGREAFENEDSEAVKVGSLESISCVLIFIASQFAKQTPSQALIIGYVSSGGYSLNRGEGFAIGHVSLARMLDVCRQSKRYVPKWNPLVSQLIILQVVPLVFPPKSGESAEPRLRHVSLSGFESDLSDVPPSCTYL
jgi:ribonuclease P/MRP protein subunit POP1